MDNKSKGGYGKRPLWQWILIYAVVGFVIYGAVYYFFLAKKGGYSSGGGQSAPSYNYSQ
ncbi:MAG TPA: hypothetical protein VLE91_03200 [Candidatus Saccharimonadales bacterium]|nr:hypothetical protein [Candidatus Saccharimonadales bacterium]